MESRRIRTKFKSVSSVKRNGVRESPTGLGRTIPLLMGTREYQLNFPSSHSKRVGFLCMAGNPYALFGRLAGVIE